MREEQKLSDAQILEELKKSGMAEADAQFVVDSLPGGSVSTAKKPSPSQLAASSSTSTVGLVMLVAGLAITGGTYAMAAPGQTYVVAWGLILFGAIRLFRG